MTSCWLYQGKPFTDDMIGDNIGFVYEITNLDNNKLYIGKKLFSKAKTYQKNKKKKKTRVESNWREYTGSNSILNEHVAQGHRLIKVILHLCSTKGWMTYHETKEILNRDAIISDDYYNESVRATIHRVHLGTGKFRPRKVKLTKRVGRRQENDFPMV